MMKYQSVKVARRAMRNASKKYCNVFKTHPLDNCVIIDSNNSDNIFEAKDVKNMRAQYCLGRKVGATGEWQFLTSDGKFKSFQSPKRSIFSTIGDCSKRALPYHAVSSAKFAVFDADSQKMIQNIDVQLDKFPVQTVNLDEVKQALDTLVRARDYANTLQKEVYRIDYEDMIDLMHFIELNDITDSQKVEILNKIKEFRKRRRQMKDLLAYLTAIEGNVDLPKIIANIDKSKVSAGDNRQYNYRDKDLAEWLAQLTSEPEENNAV